jgi:hypothetical protein
MPWQYENCRGHAFQLIQQYQSGIHLLDFNVDLIIQSIRFLLRDHNAKAIII